MTEVGSRGAPAEGLAHCTRSNRATASCWWLAILLCALLVGCVEPTRNSPSGTGYRQSASTYQRDPSARQRSVPNGQTEQTEPPSTVRSALDAPAGGVEAQPPRSPASAGSGPAEAAFEALDWVTASEILTAACARSCSARDRNQLSFATQMLSATKHAEADDLERAITEVTSASALHPEFSSLAASFRERLRFRRYEISVGNMLINCANESGSVWLPQAAPRQGRFPSSAGMTACDQSRTGTRALRQQASRFPLGAIPNTFLEMELPGGRTVRSHEQRTLYEEAIGRTLVVGTPFSRSRLTVRLYVEGQPVFSETVPLRELIGRGRIDINGAHEGDAVQNPRSPLLLLRLEATDVSDDVGQPSPPVDVRPDIAETF
jgi:hypothetical protein